MVKRAKKRVCNECGEKLFGRSDKKFCNDMCRTSFNNQKRKDEVVTYKAEADCKVDRKDLFNVAEIEISYQPAFNTHHRPKLTKSIEAYQLLMDHWDLTKLELIEQFKIILLNRGNRVLGIVNLSTGGVSGTVVDPKIVFAIALKANASYIVLSHNHPSGQLQPSASDIRLTQQLIAGGEILDLKIFDHIIVTRQRFTSLSDEGLM